MISVEFACRADGRQDGQGFISGFSRFGFSFCRPVVFFVLRLRFRPATGYHCQQQQDSFIGLDTIQPEVNVLSNIIYYPAIRLHPRKAE